MTTYQPPARNDHPVLPTVLAAREAINLLEQLTVEQGPQVLVLTSACSAPSIVTIISEKEFAADDRQIFITQVGPCPAYADSDEIMLCPHDTIVIARGTRRSNAPVLVTRRESTVEQQERTLCGAH